MWPEGQSLAGLVASLQRHNADDWLDAELYSVYDYARCSKKLRGLPDDLRSVLPVRQFSHGMFEAIIGLA